MAQIKNIVIGLGNPGSEYALNRHNIGFMVLDAMAEHYSMPVWKKKFKGLMTHSTDSAGLLLIKPMTFMNLSGESAVEVMNFYKLEPRNVIVFHDDLDLAPGQVKIKQGGGSGGHNGLKSLDSHIGVNYWRIRLGIGHPGLRGDAVTNYVLGNFTLAENQWLTCLLSALVVNFNVFIEGKPADYMDGIARKVPAA